MEKEFRVLIVGGGIAGMSLAICLGEMGVSTELIDKDPEWKALGTGITITGPTFRAFSALGVESEVRRLGATNERVKLFQPPEKFIGEIGPPETIPPLPNNGGILRPVLHKILSDRTLAVGVKVSLGKSISFLSQESKFVDVRFVGGASGRFDLVVGADGAFSELRTLVFPEASEPTLTGQGCFRHLTDKPADVDCLHMFVGGAVKTGVTPCSSNQMYLFCNAPMPGNPRWDPKDDWKKLRELLIGYEGVVGSVREALGPQSNIVYRPLENFLMNPPWYRGRVVLIGDAAHATTPHLAAGAMMAVEDALVLSELIGSAVSLDTALEAFMDRRFERCRHVVENSRTLGQYELDGVSPVEHKQLQEESWQRMAAPI
ncbi:FAD-dependent monooxygenase [Myxococcota bacterium]|nr:FAD-dependent monooxygenase [Myxococcota bacterium]